MTNPKMMVALLCAFVLLLPMAAGAQSQPSGARQGVNGFSLEEGLMGKSIRTQNGEDVGEIEDVIFSRRGRISHVLVDVGGFLGMAEKTVALNLSQMRFYTDYAVFQGTRNELENMPEVDIYAFRRPYRGYYGPYGYAPYGYGAYRPYYGYDPYYGPARGYEPYGGASMGQEQRGSY